MNLSPTLHHGAPLAHRVDQGGNTLTRTESGRQYLELGSRLTAAAQGAQTEILSSASTNAPPSARVGASRPRRQRPPPTRRGSTG